MLWTILQTKGDKCIWLSWFTTVSNNQFSDSVYKTFDDLLKINKNDGAG